jgi:hypothetical protein
MTELSRTAKTIIAERKVLKSTALSSNHQLSKKQYLEIATWLFDTFDSFQINYNKDDSSEPISLTIGI